MARAPGHEHGEIDRDQRQDTRLARSAADDQPRLTVRAGRRASVRLVQVRAELRQVIG